MDERTLGAGTAVTVDRVVGALAPLARLAGQLRAEGRIDDALLLLDHLVRSEPDNIPLGEMLVAWRFDQGHIAPALTALVGLRAHAPDPAALAQRFTDLIHAAFGACQSCYAGSDAAGALEFLSLLAEILPSHPGVLTMALSCHQLLEHHAEAVLFAERLLILDTECLDARLEMIAHLRRIGDRAQEIDLRLALMQSDTALERVNRASNIYEVINLMMCQPLTADWLEKISLAQQTLATMEHRLDPPSEQDEWIRFYKAMIGGIDLSALSRPLTAPPHPLPPLYDAVGRAIGLADIQALAVRHQADAVFLVAGDEGYVLRYARLFVTSVLHNADVASLVVVHVIGGADRIVEIARAVGVKDDRLVFSCDSFDAAAITSVVLDAPTQPRIRKPTAHYQSARFHQAGWLLYALRLPLFITDLDCLLERGVRDILNPEPPLDFMLNENHVVYQFGARITANLLLMFPTPHAQRFLRFVSGYLDRQLAKPDLAKFIDQIALAMGQHYMKMNHPDVKVGYFDVARDINNCILLTYMEHPFRFLSLYQKFDLASLPAFYVSDPAS